jgi:hypothetical protein
VGEIGYTAAVGVGREPVRLEVLSGGDVPAPVSSVGDRLAGWYRTAARFAHQRVLFRAARAVPRTLHFVASSLSSGVVTDTLPAPRMSVGLAAQVALDEALLAMAMTPRRFPHRDDYTRVGAELADAEAMFARRGWLADPRAYHRSPPPLSAAEVATTSGWANGLRYERISWESGFAPHPGEAGGDRWMDFAPNRTATAVLASHADGPRPWVIAVHGFCMGVPFMDFPGLQVARLHRQLGFNVALPVLPLHGSRKVSRISGEPLLSFDLMNAVHGLTQAVWDIRRLVQLVRQEGATSISLYGVSLGAYVASLVAGLEDGVDAVVAGIPVSDFPGLFERHSPRHIRARASEHRLIGSVSDNVYRVVSPMSFQTSIPKERRFIFAGYGDRLALPDQAERLWQHWDRPTISWYAGSHVGYMFSRQVADFLAASLSECATVGAASNSRG